jgi:hypothetical protein
MAHSVAAASLPDYPPELIQAVVRDASRDADHVGVFLKALGLSASPEKPLSLPAHFLLELGAALRLLSWESRGFFIHQQAGLPAAREALRAVFSSLSDPSAAPTELPYRVMCLSVENFAWNAQEELRADVCLEEAEEEMLLEALADFLWAHRPR